MKSGWLPYIDSSCPRIVNVTPEALQLNRQKTSTVSIYYCNNNIIDEENDICNSFYLDSLLNIDRLNNTYLGKVKFDPYFIDCNFPQGLTQ